MRLDEMHISQINLKSDDYQHDGNYDFCHDIEGYTK